MSGKEQVLLFVVLAWAMIGGLLDAYTTQLGFSVGLVEGNPVARYLIKKFGIALATFLPLSAFLVSTMALSVVSSPAAIAYATVIGIVETIMPIRNYTLYKKFKK